MQCQQLVVAASLFAGLAPAAAPVPVPTTLPAQDILCGSDAQEALAYTFTAEDHRLLDEVEHAAFLFFWKEVGQPAQLAKDRLKGPVASIAAVGFQLASLPIGVERGWIKKDEGFARARTVLTHLMQRDDNKRYGVYLHYPDLNTGGYSNVGYEEVASTVDHALLMAGALVAAEYFGEEIGTLVERLVADTNWAAFIAPDGFLSMGWQVKEPHNIPGPGELLKATWWAATDEERLIYFLAAGAPRADHAVPPETYYKLARHVKRWEDQPPFVVAVSGAMFCYFFSHCYVDYRSLGPDDPRALGVDAPRVDWWENSRRAFQTHRYRCTQMAATYKTLGPNRWGNAPCVGKDGYLVPDMYPNLLTWENWHEGTLAPYAAASAIMFDPRASLAALREFRSMKDTDGRALLWHDPKDGGFGLPDAFNLDQKYIADDVVGIDHGPMLLAIENARTGLIWRLFMQHEVSRRAVERLKLTPREKPDGGKP